MKRSVPPRPQQRAAPAPRPRERGVGNLISSALGTLRRRISPPEPEALTLTPFIYELLDALDDTARLAHELELDLRWEVHLDYLRGLQRRGRELLAGASA